MKKSLTVIILSVFLAISSSVALAKTIKCSVVQIEENQVTLECKSTDGLNIDDKVKVKTSPKKAIEGC